MGTYLKPETLCELFFTSQFSGFKIGSKTGIEEMEKTCYTSVMVMIECRMLNFWCLFLVNGLQRLMSPWLAIGLFFLVSTSHSEALKEIEESVKHSGIKKHELSLYVTNREGRKIYALNENQQFVPASVTKLIAAAATLDTLPENYKFTTRLKSVASQNQQILKGALYLVGGGDPSFVSESLWDLVNQFIRTDIRVVEGDIIVDDTMFDSVRYDSGRVSERNSRAYDAPVGAMSFNWNSVNIYVRPSMKKGTPGRVYLDPGNGYTSLVNRVRTVGGAGSSLRVTRKKMKAGDQFIVSGSIGVRSSEKVIYR